MQAQWRQDFGLLRTDRSRVRSQLITTNYEESMQFAYPKVPTATISTLLRIRKNSLSVSIVKFFG